MDDMNGSKNYETEYYIDQGAEVIAEGEVTRKTFNLVLGGAIMYGIVVNILMCMFCAPLAFSINPFILLIGYIACSFAGITIANKSDKPAVSFLGYNLLVVPLGLVLTIMVTAYGGVTSPVVLHTFVMTMEITAIMVIGSVVFPAVFEKMGGFLFIALIGILIASVIEIIIRQNFTWLSFIAALVFSLYIGYDIRKAQKMRPTVDNAIDCALSVYLDIINLFMRLLSISGSKGKK
ncbi:MAG: Bax inhibitor-1 family protein [Lachnospiraceae bacterium]|nr:Bax inhibitor-1 family protein [Lachnospiraceae bacterium]